jgi:Cu/Zn superoxide dismutase
LRRITKAALGGVAGCALVLGGTQAASGVLSEIYREQSENLLVDSGGPFDYAKATLEIAVDVEGDRTTFNLDLTKIDPSQLDLSQLDPSQPKIVLGSHLHTGPCVEETGASAGPHYNHEVVTKSKSLPTGEKTYGYTAEVSPNTEVWFDLELTAEGTTASDETTVPFVPVDPDGVMSVVVHVRETNTEFGIPTPGEIVGSAGARQACFPLSSVSGIFPATATK